MPSTLDEDRSGTYDALTDDQLVRACARRDVAALRELYVRHGAKVLATARVMARRRPSVSADDLTVEAFNALWWTADDAETRRRGPLAFLLIQCGRQASTTFA